MKLKLLTIGADHHLLLSAFRNKNGIIEADVINGLWFLHFDTNTKILSSKEPWELDLYDQKPPESIYTVDTYRLISITIDQNISLSKYYNIIINEALSNVKENNGEYTAHILTSDILK